MIHARFLLITALVAALLCAPLASAQDKADESGKRPAETLGFV
ncbi:hypothetical protein [Marinobacter gelidimuriae]|nr:hypothetical protein [Marinobacter gelidimuriae]